jgi:protein-tyrosine-phosphatase
MKNDAQKTVLFVCVENAARSQMAEAFFNIKYAPKGYRAISAGTRPSSRINRDVVQVMKELNISIGGQRPKMVNEDMIRNSVKAVNMGCLDKSECPMLFLSDNDTDNDRVIDWGIEDPEGKSIDQIRQIRDEIEIRVKQIAESLKPDCK